MVMALTAIIGGSIANAQSPKSLPNPNEGNPNNYVADPYNQLSADTKSYINNKLASLRRETTAEMAVAVVMNLDGMSVEDYGHELFEHWGLGKSDNNNGVLLLIATGDKRVRIDVGSGMEGVLTDIACANIIRGYLAPAIRSGNLNQAVASTVNEICEVLTNPAVAKEIQSKNPDGLGAKMNTLDRDVFLDFIMIVVAFVFVFSLCMLIMDFIATRKQRNYRRAMTWRNHLATYWWGAGLSLGLALPIALIALYKYKRARNVREICDTCGAMMNKLSEDEDNAFLTASQDFEENLGTVDYDVWLCPECGTVARFPFVEHQLKYKECPECHTIAMNLAMEKVVTPATTRHEGLGERAYQCQYCKYIKREQYRIPKKEDGAAFAAGLAAGAMLGRGGGSGSGGFGGGHSSGGGASGSW